MKLFIGLMSLVVSLASLASSGETKTFTYDGSRPSLELLLTGDKTHTEYRYEQRPSICYRTEIAGYRTICTGGHPGPRPRPNPRPVPGQCYRQPIYRTVSYPCMETVRIPYEVKDFDVEARLVIDVTNLSDVVTSGETFKVTLLGDDLTISAIGSKKFFIVQKVKDIRSSMNGNVKFLDGILAVELIEASPVLNALALNDIHMQNPVLNFKLGPVEARARSNIGFSLNIIKKRTFGSDTTLFNRNLDASEIQIVSGPGSSTADIDLSRIGVELVDGKFSVTAKAFLKIDGSLMNESQFGDSLESSKTLIYTIH